MRVILGKGVETVVKSRIGRLQLEFVDQLTPLATELGRAVR
jgi:hypothetical protein